MKKLITLFFIVFAVKANAQEYPLGTSPSNLPPYSYIKDVNNEYNKYVGLWKGNWNGKTIYIEFKKVKYNKSYSIPPYYIDKILGERKIIAANGTVEIDRISNFDYQHPEIRGLGPITGVNTSNYRSFMFYPKDMCGIYARLAIINITPTQMTLHLTAILGGTDGNCIHDAYVQQHGEYPLNFPKDIVLTKQ